MKDVFVAGDTLDNKYSLSAFKASDGWTLKFRLIPNVAGPAPIQLTCTASGDDFLLQLGPTSTANWTPGDYGAAVWVEKSGARYSVETDPSVPGQVTILPNPQTVTVLDTRSDARKNLAAIEAFLGGRASNAVQEYEINGRRLVNYKPAELITLASYFRRQVSQEEVAAALASGMGNPRHLFVRFG
jgi:hypothetical protein